VVTDGKQFTGRFTKPRPAEVFFERICRENGITARLTRPRSPTTTGKIERFHKTLRRELLDEVGESPTCPRPRPPSTRGCMAITTPGLISRWTRPFRRACSGPPCPNWPNPAPRPWWNQPRPSEQDREEQPAAVVADASTPPRPAGPDAVEFDRLMPVSGYLGVLPRVQRIRLGKALAGRWVRIWADRRTVHVCLDGRMLKTVPSRLSAEDLQELRMQGAPPAGPPPAPPAPDRASTLPAGAAIEVDRTVGADGFARGDRDGILITHVPFPDMTSSKTRVNLASRSRTKRRATTVEDRYAQVTRGAGKT
jgi:hypothetical protein